MHRMMPKHVLAPEIGSTTVGLARLLVTTVDTPLGYLNEELYAELRMLKGCVSQLLACDEQYRGELKTLLMKYIKMLPTELPKRAPPN